MLRNNLNSVTLAICLGICILINLTVFAASSKASVIPDRTTLNTILGGGAVTDDFESYAPVTNADSWPSINTLDNSTVLVFLSISQGPGLVNAAARYSGTSLQWNNNGYFGLPTRTVMFNGTQILITYNSPVRAMGVDLLALNNIPNSGTAEVFGPAGLIASVPISALGGANTSFFGYESGSGITSVRFISTARSWSFILDNHTYGGTVKAKAVPTMTEWGMIIFMIVAGIGAVYYLRRQRRAER
jgi:hypothetical protein